MNPNWTSEIWIGQFKERVVPPPITIHNVESSSSEFWLEGKILNMNRFLNELLGYVRNYYTTFDPKRVAVYFAKGHMNDLWQVGQNPVGKIGLIKDLRLQILRILPLW